MPAVATDNATPASSRPLIRITAAAGTALLVLVLASPHLAAQVVEVPVAVPAVNALTESAAEAGTTKIVTRDFDWFDRARNRAVPVRLYLPAQTAPAQRLPLVVFSHGMGGSRRGYSYLGAYWASHGYASLHLQHVGSDRSLWSGNIFGLVGRLQGAAQEEEAIARVEDLRFALDQVLADQELGSRIDAKRIVGAGHSYGANTVMLALGARILRQDRIIDLFEPRLSAAVLLSAPPFYGESNMAGILAEISVPTLHITATEDIIRIPGYYSGVADRIAVFDAMPGAHKVLAVFDGGSHSMFTDRNRTGGVALNSLVKAATRELSVAFFESALGGSNVALRNWPARHDSILAKFLTPGY
ncbi:acetylhydrolase [Candidatus Accumulibacter phosphatis]|uniref:Acetylhydrolase n=1 Tax=Candidatus Accumulibacter phosphatis TaxID=327160 RepID=A0ABX1TYB2_9PROT|nr:acetylhydrolase [Candidatus Accumulibacter phosphatis]